MRLLLPRVAFSLRRRERKAGMHRGFKTTLTGLLLALSPLPARPAGAAEPRAEPAAPVAGGPVQLPPVVIPLPPEPPAAQSPSRRDPSGAVSLVDAAGHQGEAKDVAELLATTPGLGVQDSGGLGQAKQLSIRGASPNGVQVLLDGVPLNGAGGAVDLSRIPPAVIDQLEVLRGGAGARYGSGGLGGVVNIVTRKPQRGARLFAEATHGAFNTTLAHVGGGGPLLGGQGLILLHGARTDGDFPFRFDDQPSLPGNPLVEHLRQNNQSQAAGGLLKFRRDLGAAVTLDAVAQLSAESRGLAGTAQNPDALSGQSSQLGLLSARMVKSWLGGAQLEARAFGKRDRIRLTGAGNPVPYDQVDSAAGVELTGSTLLKGRHGLSATAELGTEWLGEPTGVNPSWVRAAAMASDEILFFDGTFTLTPSFRVDRTGPFTGVSPKLGAALLLPAGFELRANAGQAHRAPSFLELYVLQGRVAPNNTLVPERALYVDAALSHRTSRSLLSVGGFSSLYENLITYEYYPDLLARPKNFAAARVSGLEVEGELRPTSWLSLAAGDTWLFSQNLRDDPRYYLKDLPYRPRHAFYGRLAAGPPIARARVELLYQSEQFQNRTATVSIPERAYLNLGIGSQFHDAPQLSASLELKNAFDTQSEDQAGYPLPGRAAYLTLAVAWDVQPRSESPEAEAVAKSAVSLERESPR